jgi:hypothetical protein
MNTKPFLLLFLSATLCSAQGWMPRVYIYADSTPTSPPTITSEPSSAAQMTNGSVSFSVGASGPGTLFYQWQTNSVNVANGGIYSGATGSTLTMNPVGLIHSNYGLRCVVTNSFGAVTSSVATLTVTNAGTLACSETPDMYLTNLANLDGGYPINGSSGTDVFYVGNLWPNDQAETNICQINAGLWVTGDVSAKFYAMRIYSMADAGSVLEAGNILGQSAVVAGSNISTNTAFIFASPVTQPANSYGAHVVYNCDSNGDPVIANDAVNYVRLYMDWATPTVDQIIGSNNRWTIAGVFNGSSGPDKDFWLQYRFYK